MGFTGGAGVFCWLSRICMVSFCLAFDCGGKKNQEMPHIGLDEITAKLRIYAQAGIQPGILKRQRNGRI